MVHLQVYINSITCLAETLGNNEGDRGEQRSGKWEGGGGRGNCHIMGYTNSIRE